MVSILVGCHGWGGGHFYVFSFLHVSEHSEHVCFFCFLGWEIDYFCVPGGGITPMGLVWIKLWVVTLDGSNYSGYSAGQSWCVIISLLHIFNLLMINKPLS